MRTPTVLNLGATALIVLAMSAASGALPTPASAAEPTSITTAAPGPSLGDISRVEELQSLLARDRGKYRVVLLLSPT